MARRKKSQGLGDTIANITHTLGIDKLIPKDCGCDERREKLNRLFPYKFKPRCFTDEEYNWYSEYLTRNSIKVSKEVVKALCELHASIFNLKSVWYPCVTCSPKPLIEIINRLDLHHKNHSQTIE
jgi:hypothetical protein